MLVLTKGQNAPLTAASVVVSLRCAANADVSALMLGENGLVPDDEAFLFYNQPTAPGLRLQTSAGAAELHTDTAAIPSRIDRIVITASLDGSGPATFAAAGPISLEVFDSAGASLMSYTIDDAGQETAMLCVELYRRGAAWKLRALGQGYADGLAGIARDFGVDVDDPAPVVSSASGSTAPIGQPTLGAGAPTPHREPDTAGPSPSAPTTKVNLDKGKVSLVKGQTVSLVKTGAPALNKVTMGLGWDPTAKGRSVDLDASVIAYDARGNDLAKVWFMGLKAFGGAIAHSGDNVTGKGDGDDEQIVVELSRVPASTTTLLFTVNSFSGQTFDHVASAYCRLLDDRGAELVRFSLTDAPKMKGVFMCRLDRTAAGSWDMTALGIFEDARTVKGMHKAAKRLFFSAV